jgi:DNA (cytosine-5)-methyltransferase 1
MLKVLDLFSGIGGFSLGLERTGGFKTVAFCEIEPYPRKVLAKHWPEVPCYHDIRELTAERLAADGIGVDVICGGFPCQDISVAGNGAGLAGERSGLWSEFARLIGEIRPRYAIVENVAALLFRGLADVLGDLAALRYDAEWHCIPASAVGAPHRRDRIWIVAHPRRLNSDGRCGQCGGSQEARSCNWPARSNEYAFDVADASGNGWAERGKNGDSLCVGESGNGFRQLGGMGSTLADANEPQLQRCLFSQKPSSEASQPIARRSEALGHAKSARQSSCFLGLREVESWRASSGVAWWGIESDVGRVANGVPSRVDRLKGLGNAVVPQIPELIGRAILAAGT